MRLLAESSVAVLVVILSLTSYGTPRLTPVYASMLIFGVPSEAVKPYLGRNAPIANFFDLAVNGQWWRGVDFSQSLYGTIVESGNAYHIGAGPDEPVTPESILVGNETGIEFPLKVVGIRWDPIAIIYENETGSFSTYFNLMDDWLEDTVPNSNEIIAVFHGGHNGGWVGRYVLVNGIMVKIADRWAPQPLSQNAQIRINGLIYPCYLVYVYYFPWAH